VIDKFDFPIQIERLRRADLLYQVVGKFADIDLHPRSSRNIEMGLPLTKELILPLLRRSPTRPPAALYSTRGDRLMVNLLFICMSEDRPHQAR